MAIEWGNKALGAMVETAPPAADISLMPQAYGWRVLIGLFLLYLGWIIIRRVGRNAVSYYRNRYRREALAWIESLPALNSDSLADGEILAQYRKLPAVLRATALHLCDRTQLSGITGENWETWLDQHCEGAVFAQTFQGQLYALAYHSVPAEGDSVPHIQSSVGHLQALVAHVHFWIENHRGKYD